MFTKARKTPRNIFTVLDIGSSKIRCLMAHMNQNGIVRIIGAGQQTAKGIKAGNITQMEAVEECILNAVYTAEQMAGHTSAGAFINLGCGHPKSFFAGHSIKLPRLEVTPADLKLLMQPSNFRTRKDTRQVIHLIPISYALDSNKGIQDPSGMYGKTLGVTMNVVTAETGPVRNLANAIDHCHLDINAMVASGYAAGLSSLVPDEKAIGGTVIDIGGGTTDIAVFSEGKLVFTDSVPIGGIHITNDIARGLSTPLAQAEKLKVTFGDTSYGASQDHSVIEIPQIGEEGKRGAQAHVPRSMLVSIIKPRIEEIFEMVNQKLHASGAHAMSGRSAVLTGGTSQLTGIREIASRVLDKKTRLGAPLLEDAKIENNPTMSDLSQLITSPEFSTAVGVLRYAVEKSTREIKSPMMQDEYADSGSLFQRMAVWLKENF